MSSPESQSDQQQDRLLKDQLLKQQEQSQEQQLDNVEHINEDIVDTTESSLSTNTTMTTDTDIEMQQNPDSPRELVNLTNVNVMDLQKDFTNDNQQQSFIKETSVYVFSTASSSTIVPPTIASNNKLLSGHTTLKVGSNSTTMRISSNSGHNSNTDVINLPPGQAFGSAILQRPITTATAIPSTISISPNTDSSGVICGTGGGIIGGNNNNGGGNIEEMSSTISHPPTQLKIIDSRSDTLKIIPEDQVLQFLANNGNVNGEHIITRMENGEHILTRLDNGAQVLARIISNNNNNINITTNSHIEQKSDIIYTTTSTPVHHKLSSPNATTTIYSTNDPTEQHITTSVLQYGGVGTNNADDINGNGTVIIVGGTSGSNVTSRGGICNDEDDLNDQQLHKQKHNGGGFSNVDKLNLTQQTIFITDPMQNSQQHNDDEDNIVDNKFKQQQIIYTTTTQHNLNTKHEIEDDMDDDGSGGSGSAVGVDGRIIDTHDEIIDGHVYQTKRIYTTDSTSPTTVVTTNNVTSNNYDEKTVIFTTNDELLLNEGSQVIVQSNGIQQYAQQINGQYYLLTETVDSERFYEHPLSAVSSAMLISNNGQQTEDESNNINGGGNVNMQGNLNTLAGQSHSTVLQHANVVENGDQPKYVYEQYYLPSDKDSIQWSTPTGVKLNGQTTPSLDTMSLSQNEIQGLLIGSHPTTHSISVKREPEDLRKDPKNTRNQQKISAVPPTTSPVLQQIKDPPHSPGSPSDAMYGTSGGYLQASIHHQMNPTASTSGSNLNTNTPSPGPYGSTDQYGIYATRIASGNSTFVTTDQYEDRYYYESQNYTTTNRQIYVEDPNAGGTTNNGTTVIDGTQNSNVLYDNRYTTATTSPVSSHTKNTPIYPKTVTAAAAAAAAAVAGTLAVDLPSPDSGIGADAVITPRDQSNMQQSFDYQELCSSQLMDTSNGPIPVSVNNLQRVSILPNPQSSSPAISTGSQSGTRTRGWHDFGRQSDVDKVTIEKLFISVGFRYHLESPISSSQRREDDRITYINKGQFYGITLEHVHDAMKPLKNQTVKSVIMLMFREEKSPDDEIKAWTFWHGRQHSIKQRILDADTKNSIGLAGTIEEIAHNAIAVYWNPLESSAKINIAVQCLSTDFSSQKGVKGLPLHIQIDTFEDYRDGGGPPSHRGYCQIKVFCDKGAERKTRDEERRSAKRKLASMNGRKKMEDSYHPTTERSEFYAMKDLDKPPVLFIPNDPPERIPGMDLPPFYSSGGGGGGVGGGAVIGSNENDSLSGDGGKGQYLLHTTNKPTTPTLKFHNHFPQDIITDKKDHLIMDQQQNLVHTQLTDYNSGAGGSGSGSVSVNVNVNSGSIVPAKKMKMSPPITERVMLYVRQEQEPVYTPLHVVPPTIEGLIHAIEKKYNTAATPISNVYRKNRKGDTVKMDNDMLSYYCNEDTFLLEVRRLTSHTFDVTLTEIE